MSVRTERNIGSIEESETFKLAFLPEGGRFKKLYLEDSQANIDVIRGDRYELIDEDGPGQIVSFECATNNENLTLEVFVYGDNISVKRTVNAFTMSELLRLGRGLTPGEVEITPDLRSKDPAGTKDDQYPWIARWKTDTSPDLITGDSRKYIVLRFTPVVYQPYRRLVVNLYNASQTDIAHIHNMSITRFYFASIPDPNEEPPERGSPETYNVEKRVTPEEEEDEAMSYDFIQPPNLRSSDDADKEQVQIEEVEEL